jgi:hypothetical protein
MKMKTEKYLNPFKRGDIVRQEVCQRWNYFHVDYAHDNGALDVIEDRTGTHCGLSANSSKLELTTLRQLVDWRDEMARRA